MSITDELREYVWQHATNNDELRAIADRIDAEHESACAEAYGNGVMSVPIALDVADMLAENAKLRDDLEFERSENGWAREFLNRMGEKVGQSGASSLKAYVERLDAENAKLRELAADLAICACGKYCYGCPHQYDGCDRDQKLRELGIEVDDG